MNRNHYLAAANDFAAMWHTANLLADGNVMLVGGWRGGDSPSGQVDVFDVLAGRFRDAGWLRMARQYHRTVNLHDGRLLVTGGDAWCMDAASAELIDPGSGRIEDTGAPVEGRSDHTATVLRDGRVLLAGGLGANGEGPSGISGTAEIWDPETGEFRLVADTLAIPRVGHSASLLPDGRVLIVGGWTSSTEYRFAELFDPGSERFSVVPCPDDRARRGHGTLQLRDGSVLVLGGGVLRTTPQEAWLPDASVLCFFADGTGADIAAELPAPRALVHGALGPDGRAWLFGGMTGWEVSARAETYGLAEGCVCIQSLPAPRHHHTVTCLADGRFLIAGGQNEWNELTPEALICG